ncbi:hypothetical protein GCM10008090_17100 [Arenicella chitinivorans]|uniref:DUF2170 family protein n=1 Tax=Arenicella chitinivorans TaxID=1329800 RepID=A0A918RR62_9GAMM|nr:YjfI family protein [Arenicella chitinivorans]GHA07852.1 hypothetical protein GCM10008090_17100 [Arenicella chitinivorans]
MKRKTSADYQREYRKRLREQGLVKKEVWILPENGTQLNKVEKMLRYSQLNGSTGLDIGEQKNMNNSVAHRWTTESLFTALKDRPTFSNGSCSIEIIDGIDSSIVIAMHEYGDLPIFITAGGDQILAEAVLFSADDVKDTAKFNEYVLKTHKYLPLSTISLDHDETHGDYYHMFGALSATSSINDVVHEIEVLAENVIQATEAFRAFLKI